MTSSLSKDFLEGKGETDITHTIDDLTNSVDNYRENGRGPHRLRFELSTKSVFIHGGKSHVKFDFYGKPSTVELGDLIFMCTVVFKGKKHFEKLTITQFKMEGETKNVTSWGIDNEEQLFLLSRFPQFRVIRGILPKKTYNLPNMSACLGSYGLLFKPGDFTFVSATILDALLGHGKTVRQSELSGHFGGLQTCFSLCRPIFDDCHLSPNTYVFADRFLKLNIGEPTYNSLGTYNQQARTLIQNLIGQLRRRRASKHHTELEREKLTEFIRDFGSYPYDDENNVSPGDDSDAEAGDDGIRIVHTTINLGESAS